MQEIKNVGEQKSLKKKKKKSILREDIDQIQAVTQTLKKKGINLNSSDNITVKKTLVTQLDFTEHSRNGSTEKKLTKKSLSTSGLNSGKRERYLKT